jgi:hypothetical protein
VVIVGRVGIRQRRRLAAPHGDGGARIERSLHRRFVGALGERLLVHVAATAKPCHGARLHAPDDRVQVLACGSRSRMEDHPRVRITAEDPIEHDHVEMDVEIQASKSLNKVDRTALPCSTRRRFARVR